VSLEIINENRKVLEIMAFFAGRFPASATGTCLLAVGAGDGWGE
jgi:hypothetical protein